MKMQSVRKILLLASVFTAFAAQALTDADWRRAEQMSGDSLSRYVQGVSFSPSWIKGTRCFYYTRPLDNGCAMTYVVDAASGRRRPVVADTGRFYREYMALSGDTASARLCLNRVRFEDGNADRFYISRGGKTYSGRVGRGGLRPVPALKREAGMKFGFTRSHHSPDSAYTMLGCGYDLYLRNNATGAVRRITDDGTGKRPHTSKCTADTLEKTANGFWLGNRYIQIMIDNSEVKEAALIHSLGAGRPEVDIFRMPMPGDSGVRRYRILWYNPESDETRYLPIDKYPDQTVDVNYDYTPERMFFTRRSRPGDRIDLCRIDVPAGTVEEIITEECRPHINLTLFNYRLLEGGRRILWWSERTGFGSYYLYDGTGRLLNRVTGGDRLVAGMINRIDTVGNTMIFEGYGNRPGISPYYKMYYKVSLDGRRQTLLTPEDANHDLSISPDGKYAVDRYSRIDMSGRLKALLTDAPDKGHVVDSVDTSRLRAAGWRPPVRFTVKAADDSTELWGIMYLPSNFDPAAKYPVISNVYPGPQDDQIPQSFYIDDNGNQSLAELGFVVITSPSRGSSPLRGHDFYNFGHGNLRDYPLADDKHTIETLAASRPWMDLNRVGIYGHSGGGFQTAAAMMTYPEFYRTGVAASGNHDNNIYIQWWAEAFQGVEQSTDSVSGRTVFKCKVPTNAELAPRLRGDLLLITGDEDKNVPPSNTYRLADALIRAGRRFDMFILPGKDHGVQCPYYYNLIRYYFTEHLLNPQKRHNDIINHINQ